ncbi:MAG: class II aldolase/adducin family protein [Tepidisphaerales bacterium]
MTPPADLYRSALDELLTLSHRIGRAGDLAILAEGNTSVRLPSSGVSAGRFLVKASGHRLADLDPDGVVCCEMAPLLAAVEADDVLSEEEVEALLRSVIVPAHGTPAGTASPRLPSAGPAPRPEASSPSSGGTKPSVEAFFHAVLLARPSVAAVAHAHPEDVLAVMCSPLADDFAARRRFPDEVVCCGPTSMRLPYIDPGLALARELHRRLPSDRPPPPVILLDNHGVICPAATAGLAWSALAMTAKAARVYTRSAALSAGRPPTALPDAEVHRIHHRLDEAHRRKQLER